MQLNPMNPAKPLFFDSSLEALRGETKTAWKDPVFFRAELLITLICLVIFPLTWWVYRNVPPEIPLFYSRPWGEPQLVSASILSRLAAGSIVVVAVHTFLAIKFHENHRFLSQVILWSGIYILAVVAISILTVYSRVGRTGL